MQSEAGRLKGTFCKQRRDAAKEKKEKEPDQGEEAKILEAQEEAKEAMLLLGS